MEDEKMGGEVVNSGRADYLGKARGNPWMVSTLVLAVALILVLIFNFRGDGLTGGTVSSANAGQNLVDFISAQGAEAEIVSAERDGSLYKVMVNVDGQTLPVYVTVDGRYAIAQPIPLVDTDDSDTQPTQPTQPNAGTKVNVEIGDSPVKGDANAPVTIIEFSDYECPFCGKAFDETLPLIEKNYIDTGKVKYVFKDFPLDFHPSAQPAAEAARCFGEQKGDEGYYKYHDKLFENQELLSEENYKKWARELGADGAKFDTCLSSGKYADAISEDMAYGQTLGVSGTPAFFIGNSEDGYILVSGAQPYANFENVIEAVLTG